MSCNDIYTAAACVVSRAASVALIPTGGGGEMLHLFIQHRSVLFQSQGRFHEEEELNEGISFHLFHFFHFFHRKNRSKIHLTFKSDFI